MPRFHDPKQGACSAERRGATRRNGAHGAIATGPERPAGEPVPGDASPGDDGAMSARDVVERFLGDVQRGWTRSVPTVDDLWQPPGE
jgi:hypothetical protein